MEKEKVFMNIKRVGWLLTLAVLSAMVVSAADVTGKWVAQMPGRDGGTQEITFMFKMSRLIILRMTHRIGIQPPLHECIINH